MANYIKLRWWNTCDLGRVYYQDGFKNLIFLETDIIKPEYVNEEEGFNNGEGVFVKTSELLKKRYRFEVLAPEYVANALKFMALHEFIELTIIQDGNILYQTAIRNVQTNVAWENVFTDCLATIEVLFEQDDQVFKSGCCENLV